MPFTPLVTAGIETALNTFLWRDKALKPARQRLLGKVLRHARGAGIQRTPG